MNCKALLIAAAREIGLNTKHTGGGCMALSLETSGNNEILITDDGGASVPASLWENNCILGIYGEHGECFFTKQGRAIDLLSFALNYPNSIKGE